MANDGTVELIIYGDFNCPFSALANTRANRLERLGRAKVDWRAVEHAPDIPPTGHPVTGALRSQLASELELIHEFLTADETDQLLIPSVQSNTNLATSAYAATPPSQRSAVRSRLFTAYWCDGADIADSATLTDLGIARTDEPTASRWRDEWLALTEPIVPTMILPDGYVSRGLGALTRLADLATSIYESEASDDEASVTRRTSSADTDLGGEAPCYAHLHQRPLD